MYKKIVKENKQILRSKLKEVSNHMKSGGFAYYDNMRICHIKPKNGMLLHVAANGFETVRVKPDIIELEDDRFVEDLNSRLEFTA